MNETILKRDLVKLAREKMKKFVIIRHEDHFTHGIPDISFTGNKRTSWIEVKYADPGFKSKGIQELTMSRLALAGLAYYVVYYTSKSERRTFIVDPTDIGNPIESWTRFVSGFNHDYVIGFIWGAHLYDYNGS